MRVSVFARSPGSDGPCFIRVSRIPSQPPLHPVSHRTDIDWARFIDRLHTALQSCFVEEGLRRQGCTHADYTLFSSS
eukprot:4526715-Amphidinium_carterae.1